ncbi:MAG TPA: nitric oxide-sensing protein NosP [Azospirillaceae bacterium]|nr:nitric oxide-sensing protein NosP [Azospirillaceae bacterium]HRQ80917.1 nitric oxide-sensing protein NosP [Azospirillaceae bacterium]
MQTLPFAAAQQSAPKSAGPAAGGSSLPRGASQAQDEWDAARELHAQVWRHDLEMVLVFISPRYDRARLATALNAMFGETPVVGCTTAGEITPFGYQDGAVTGVGFPKAEFSIVAELIPDIDRFEISHGAAVLRSVLKQRNIPPAGLPGGGKEQGSFAFLMIDGMSTREELVVSALHNVLVGVPLFGGSAGDDLKFENTFILHGGRFHTNAAVLMLFTTTRRFSVFRTEHFVSSGRKMVVTGADPQRRVVTEINAEPAGPEYARMVGLEGVELTPMVFAAHPVVVRVGGEYHVRSIQKVNEDESLSFFCAIDEGIVLTVAEGVDIVENLQALMKRLEAEVGPPDLVLSCDCILRRLEIEQRQLTQPIAEIMRKNNAIGFNAYGEQYSAMHVNQTLTGVAIGRR